MSRTLAALVGDIPGRHDMALWNLSTTECLAALPSLSQHMQGNDGDTLDNRAGRKGLLQV